MSGPISKLPEWTELFLQWGWFVVMVAFFVFMLVAAICLTVVGIRVFLQSFQGGADE